MASVVDVLLVVARMVAAFGRRVWHFMSPDRVNRRPVIALFAVFAFVIPSVGLSVVLVFASWSWAYLLSWGPWLWRTLPPVAVLGLIGWGLCLRLRLSRGRQLGFSTAPDGHVYASIVRKWSLVGLIAIPIIVGSPWAARSYRLSLPPSSVIVLVARFDGPNPTEYRVTEWIIDSLRTVAAEHEGIEIAVLGEHITEEQGEARAAEAGRQRKATIVVWGWYGLSGEKVPLSVHFRLLRPPLDEISVGTSGGIRLVDRSSLESFELQIQLADEMAVLTLVCAGLMHYASGDWHGAIARLDAALARPAPIGALERSRVHLLCANAHWRAGNQDCAIVEYDQAIALAPDDAEAFHGRALAYFAKYDISQALADCNRSIELDPTRAYVFNTRGVLLTLLDDFDQAIKEYSRAIELDPSDALYLCNRGATYVMMGVPSQALEDFDRAVRLQPRDHSGYELRGVALSLEGHQEKALADFARAIRLRPDEPGPYLNRAIARARMGDYDGAVVDLNRAIQLAPDCATAYFNRAIALWNKGRLDDAIEDYTTALGLEPDWATYYYRGRAHYDAGYLGRAVDDFSEAIRLYSLETAYGTQRRKTALLVEQGCYRCCYHLRGCAYLAMGQLGEAVADFSVALQLGPDSESFYGRGVAHLGQGELDLAIGDFDEAIRLQPHCLSYLVRGNAFYQKGYLDQAISDLSEAIGLGCNLPEAYVYRGDVYAARGELERAVADYGEGIRLEPGDGSYYLKRGVALLEIGDLDGAIGDLTLAISVIPSAVAYHNRGIALALRGAMNEAISDFSDALRLMPDLAAAYVGRGNAYAIEGSHDQAIADYSQAIRLRPEDAAAYVARGQVYVALGQIEQAIIDYTSAIQVWPTDPIAYYQRGQALLSQGEREKAITDFEMVLEFCTDTGLRQRVEEKLDALRPGR